MAESEEEKGRGAEPGAKAPAKPALSVDDDYSKYEVTSRSEILAILRSMREQGSLITFYFNHGYDFLLTSLVEIAADGKTMIFDYGSNMEMNRKALQADKINCVSSKDKVRIQFLLQGVDPTKSEGRDAFLSDVPDFLIRLQRREHYRLATPMSKPVRANIPILQADGALKLVQLVVADISGGGVGLNIPHGELSIQRDAQYAGVTLNLPDIGVATVDMRVRNIHEVTMANGKTHQRAVCQFVNLAKPMVNLIQRYIAHIDRERLARKV